MLTSNLSCNPDKMHYRGFTMQELKQLIKKIDEQIADLQGKRNILQKSLQTAAEVEKQLKNLPEVDYEVISQSRGRDVFPEPEEIEKAILNIKGEFRAEDAAEAVKIAHLDKQESPNNSIATALHHLIKTKRLEYVRERRGRRPAIYKKL